MDVVSGRGVALVALVALLLGVPVTGGDSSGSDSRFCHCPWRYALANLQ